MANRFFLSVLNILWRLRCNSPSGSGQVGQMTGFMLVCLSAVCKLHLETQIQTGARNKADIGASGVLTPNLCSLWDTGKIILMPGCPIQELGESSCWWAAWISQKPPGTILGWPVGLRGSLSISKGSSVLSDHNDPTLNRPALQAFPWELDIHIQGSYCRSTQSLEPFVHG